jgi:hypothetical protein
MRFRQPPWRLLLPAVFLTLSLVAWWRYHTSVRVTDDSPPPWSWYGDPFVAWIDFPAFVYSSPARLFTPAGFGLRIRRAWVEPQTFIFFVMIFAFWYWIGARLEYRHSSFSPPETRQQRMIWSISYALGAALWILIAIGSAYDLAVMWHVWHWYRFPQIVDSREFYVSAGVGWGAILGIYFVRAFMKLAKSSRRQQASTNVTS